MIRMGTMTRNKFFKRSKPLFLWIEIAGFIGAVRLITRTPRRLEPPFQIFVGWAAIWLVVLYAIPYVLRIFFDVNPLP